LGKEVIKEYVETGKSPKEIVKDKGLTLIGEDKLVKTIKEVIKENPQAIKDYKEGKKKALEYLIGQVLRKIRARADPKKIRELIKKNIKQ
jgi:aspartyl-tRNA(Asn)/glutamyl-tRNA(Gln) amidotransferase subunit B